MRMTEQEIKTASIERIERELEMVWENLDDSTLPYYNRLEQELANRE